MGERHLRLARELNPGSDIRVLHHRARNQESLHSDGIFIDVAAAIGFDPQIAVICNPASLHINLAQVLAEKGTHLLIEKPLSDSLTGVEVLLDTCVQKNVVLQIGYNLRFISSLQHYRELLKDNLIGKVLSVRCEVGQYLPSWRPEVDYRQTVSARQDLGGGALLELSHELDYLRWIFGEVEWVRATMSRQSDLKIDVEDSVHLALGFKGQSGGQQLIGVVDLDFIRHDRTRSCTAIGEGGTLRWHGLTGEVTIFEPSTNSWRELFRASSERDESYIAEWKSFLKSVEENMDPVVSGEDGLRVLEIIEAARKSSPTGVQVAVKSRKLNLDQDL
jgi:predicted dehydrogenase